MHVIDHGLDLAVLEDAVEAGAFDVEEFSSEGEDGLGAAVAALLGFAGYAALFIAPTERTMGVIQRIFYFHVPSAWTGFVAFFMSAVLDNLTTTIVMISLIRKLIDDKAPRS